MWNSKKILRTIESLPVYAGDIRFIPGMRVLHPISVVAHTFYNSKESNEEYLVTAPDIGISAFSDIGITDAFRELKLSIRSSYRTLHKLEEDRLGILAMEQKEALRYYMEKA